MCGHMWKDLKSSMAWNLKSNVESKEFQKVYTVRVITRWRDEKNNKVTEKKDEKAIVLNIFLPM